ncbi:MAG: hypothetical protein LBR15_01695 [Methanobrevibacter sp.]|nr:hypothetical protein [Candidatus Methanovirga australis]
MDGLLYPYKAEYGHFRERLSKFGVMNEVWSLFNEMIDSYGLESGRELSQDATYLTRSRSSKKTRHEG